MSNLKILVLGGAGFIGSHIVDCLKREGHFLRVLDRQPHQLDLTNVEFVTADISDVLAISEALVGMDAIIHLVSTSVPSTSNKDPISDVNGNLINTIKILELMRQSDVKRMIYFSSGGTVYGLPKLTPMSEHHPTEPICSYGIVKLAIEKYLQMYAKLYGFTTTILRPSNPYGPGQRHIGVQGFIGTCISNGLKNQPVTIWGDGSVIRDYLYIQDVALATLAALNAEKTGIYNISSGQGYNLNQVAEYVERALETKIELIYKQKRDFDVPEMVLANDKAEQELGWKPLINLEMGIYKTVQALKQ